MSFPEYTVQYCWSSWNGLLSVNGTVMSRCLKEFRVAAVAVQVLINLNNKIVIRQLLVIGTLSPNTFWCGKSVTGKIFSVSHNLES